MLKDIAEEMPNNVTEIFVTITEAVKNLMPLITLTKPTVFSFLQIKVRLFHKVSF